MDSLSAELKRIVEYFGEDSSAVTPQQLFQRLNQFIGAFEEAKHKLQSDPSWLFFARDSSLFLSVFDNFFFHGQTLSLPCVIHEQSCSIWSISKITKVSLFFFSGRNPKRIFINNLPVTIFSCAGILQLRLQYLNSSCGSANPLVLLRSSSENPKLSVTGMRACTYWRKYRQCARSITPNVSVPSFISSEITRPDLLLITVYTYVIDRAVENYKRLLFQGMQMLQTSHRCTLLSLIDMVGQASPN